VEWDERYARYGRPFGDRPNDFLEQAVIEGSFAPGGGEGSRILCPGDGYGRNGIWLARRGADVRGIDLSRAATDDARRWADEADVVYATCTADLSEPPYPLDDGEEFDGIVSVWFRLPRRGEREAWNRAAAGHLRPRGQILVVTGTSVTTPAQEIAEWPSGIVWADHSTGERVHLIGELLD
jgi:SAM-dependent methyltransferase